MARKRERNRERERESEMKILVVSAKGQVRRMDESRKYEKMIQTDNGNDGKIQIRSRNRELKSS